MSLQHAGYLIRCTRQRSRTCYVIRSIRAVAFLSKFNSFFIDASTPVVSVAIKKKEKKKKSLEKMGDELDRTWKKGARYLWLNVRSEDSRLAVVKITDKHDDVNLYCTRWVKQDGIERVSVTNVLFRDILLSWIILRLVFKGFLIHDKTKSRFISN